MKPSVFRYVGFLLIFVFVFTATGHADRRKFQLRYSTNIKGNVKVIGNTVLRQEPDTIGSGLTNDHLNLRYVNVDPGDKKRFNSSSASIASKQSGIDISNAKIIWAGLYWQGYLHNSDYDFGADKIFKGFGFYASSSIATIAGRIRKKIRNQTIQLKIGNGIYHTIRPDKVDMDRQRYDGYEVSYKYAAFADVTDLLKGRSPVGTYTVANLATRSGMTRSLKYYYYPPYKQWYNDQGRYPDGLGNYGAWALVIVYDNGTQAAEKLRNIAIFDGYEILYAATNPKQKINVSGFRTPTSAPNGVDSTLSIFAGEGDRNILGDYAELTNQNGYTYTLPDTSGAGSYFASVIEGVPNRNPKYLNNNGIDIHTTQVGTLGGSNRPIRTNQSKATITLGTTQDAYMPSMIAFATELYVPKLCYDYSVQLDGYDISDSGGGVRKFHAMHKGTLSIDLAIKSEVGDFDFDNSKINFRLSPAAGVTFKKAYYAPNNVNTFIPAITTAQHTPAHPSIAIGENLTSNGGKIRKLQRYFSKFVYDLSKNGYDGTIGFELNTTINFGSGPVPYLLNQDNIPRCAQSLVYHPFYGTFNVERRNSSGKPNQKYPLYTQVVGKPFAVDVVAYAKGAKKPFYSTEAVCNGCTVDVELINANVFKDKNATFVCSNPDSSVIQTLDASGRKNIFAHFKVDKNMTRVPLPPITTDTALRNAAFRIWVLVDKFGNVVPHHCKSPADNTCFRQLYDHFYKSDDNATVVSPTGGSTRGFCSVDTLGPRGCSSYVNARTGNSGCYYCLRDHFAKAICSRDNFAIRPAAYRVAIDDANEQATPTQSLLLGENNRTGTGPVTRLAAGYGYKLDINATSYAGASIVARGYTQLIDNSDSKNLFSFLKFNDKTVCFDKNDTGWGLYFANGSLIGILNGNSIDYRPGHLVRHGEVGLYRYTLYDSNWTLVDQQRYPYKTFPGIDDCIPRSNAISSDTVSKSGCDIATSLSGNTGASNPVYNDLYLYFYPYAFGVGDTNMRYDPPTKWGRLFMSRLDDSYYNTRFALDNAMAVLFDGNVTALNKAGAVTRNFTQGCAATDVNLSLSLDSNPAIDSLNFFGVRVQKALKSGVTLDGSTSFADIQQGVDANLTLPRSAFDDNITRGKARMRIYTTYRKPVASALPVGSEGVNPVEVMIKDLNASSLDARSFAWLRTYVPGGGKSFDRNVTYLYAKVSPDSKLYETVSDWVLTPMNVIAYCDLGPEQCKNYDLNSSFSASHESSNWYIASNLLSNRGDLGTSDLNVSYFAEKAPGDANIGWGVVSPTSGRKRISGVPYEITGKRNDINVTLPASNLRPVTIRARYRSVPWLEYDPANEYYDIRFIPSTIPWTGYGKTGHVVGGNINNISTSRVEW